MATADAIVTAARVRLHDSTATYAIADTELIAHYDDQAQLLAGSDPDFGLGLGHAWDTDAVTLDASNWDYELPTAADIEKVLAVRFVTDRVTIGKVSKAVLESLRQGDEKATGRPTVCALWPAADWHVQIGFYPQPAQAEVVEADLSLMPVIYTGAQSAPTVPFSAAARQALVLMIAAAAANAAGEETVRQLNLDKNSIAGWLATAKRLVADERGRIIRLKRTNGCYNYGWAETWYQT